MSPSARPSEGVSEHPLRRQVARAKPAPGEAHHAGEDVAEGMGGPGPAPGADRELPEAVRHVIGMLSGDRPLGEADSCLDARVVIHVDDAETHRGRALWKRWVHLMRERGRLRDLRFEPAAVTVEDDVARVTFTWSGAVRRGRDPGRPRTVNLVQYRVHEGRVTEIWTRKANYVDVFGAWIRVTPLYRLFLLWGVLYFLARRDPEFRLDP